MAACFVIHALLKRRFARIKDFVESIWNHSIVRSAGGLENVIRQ
jgi:hypothetical protein